MNMKYVVLGAGGTGGCIGGFLAAAGHDVTLIARGKHLAAMQENGLTIHSDKRGEMRISSVRAMTTDAYQEKADVIFVSVKGYALDGVLPFLKKAADKNTVVIPILNIYGTGKTLAEKLPELTIIEGCIYIVAYISAPGEITQSGNIFRVVYGTRGKTAIAEKLRRIAADLKESGISVAVSERIDADTYRKFVFISPFAATGAYYDCPAGVMQKAGAARDTFIRLVDEAIAAAKFQGIDLPPDLAEKTLAILDAVEPDTTASLQKDLQKGTESEMDGLIFEVARLAKASGACVPTYEKIARHFGFQP